MKGRRNKILEQRRARAEERKDARANRTPQEQLALLDQKLGKDKGASRERARLHSQIEEITVRTVLLIKNCM
jgi:hypothetical protein